MNRTTSPNSEAAILSRVIQPQQDDLPPAAARAFLKLAFMKADRDRMHELAVKNQAGALSKSEQRELESHRRIARLLDLVPARARLSLSKHRPSA
jgi:hypothetical protein